jgi:type I restriction enzyme R subunit
VTFRLADSLPAGKLTQWREEREAWFGARGLAPGTSMHAMSPDMLREYHGRFTAPILRWLDTGFGSCRLRDREAAQIVAEALRHFDGGKYALGAWVVMPNHVHVLVTPHEGSALSGIVQSWKSFSARQINALDGKRGSLWQKEFYDHIVRDDEQLGKLEEYIAANPVKAKLRAGEYLIGGMRGSASP